MQFQFDPTNPNFFQQTGDPILPAFILICVSLAGIWCVLTEWRKAKKFSSSNLKRWK